MYTGITLKILNLLLIFSTVYDRGADCQNQTSTTPAPPSANLCLGTAIFRCSNINSSGFCGNITQRLMLPPLKINNSVSFGDFPPILQPRTGPRCWNNSAGFQCCTNPCQPNPCRNGGTCTNGTGKSMFTCDCPSDFSGDHCQHDDRCSKCDQNADCKDKKCMCKPGFRGDGKTCTAECPYYEVESQCGFLKLSFSPQLVNWKQESKEECNETGRKVGSIECEILTDGSAKFARNTFKCLPCNKSVEDEQALPQNSSVDQIEDKLEEIQILTTGEKTAEDYKKTSDILVSVVTALNQKNATGGEKKISERAMKTVLDIVENLESGLKAKDENDNNQGDGEKTTASDIETAREAARNATELVDALARKVDLGGKEEVEIPAERMTVKINKPAVNRIFSNLTIEPTLYYKEKDKSGSETVLRKRTVVTLEIPSTAMQKLNEMATSAGAVPLTLVTVLYKDSTLLTVDNRTSQVIQVNYKPGESKGKEELGTVFKIAYKEKPEPSKAQEKKEPKSLKAIKKTYFCVFWDFERKKWDNTGCNFIGGSPAYCECTHFTSFALLLRVTGKLEDYDFNSLSEIYSLVASGISAFCLLVTIAIYLLVRELRVRRPTPILVNFCFCLALGYIVFIVGMDGRSRNFTEQVCYVAAAIMHVAFLCSWSWMLIYSLNMYFALVKVVGITPLVSRKAFMYPVGYLIPIVLVVTNVAVAVHLDGLPKALDAVDFESHYLASHVCWVRNKSLYFGFALPVGVVLLINVILFFVIIRKLTWKRAEIQSSKEATSVKQQIFMAITMITMMGLTWIFGYFMLFSDNEDYQKAMTIIFNVFNTAQGIVIFWVSCIRQKAVRDLWLSPVLRCCTRIGPRKTPHTKNLNSEGGSTTLNTNLYTVKKTDEEVLTSAM